MLVAADRWIAGRGVQPLRVLGVASKLGLLALLRAPLFATGVFRRGELRALQRVPGVRGKLLIIRAEREGGRD
jgi:hypothetical protein